MFENQPKGLWALALANTGERFGYYTMLAVFLLYLQANFGFETGLASTIYSTFLMMVYFLPIIGGIAADKFGFGRMVTTGICEWGRTGLHHEGEQGLGWYSSLFA